jgi:hypothetical protein
VPWLKQKLAWTNARPGGQHMVGQLGMSMQLTSWSRYLLHVALGSVPAKKAQEPPQLRVGRPPFEPVQPLAWPTSYPPVVEPMTLVIFNL